MKLKVFTAFSGYDSQCMALDRLKKDFPEFDYELVGWAEIDKYAIQAHNAVYPQWADCNYGDISKINWDEVPDFDLFTYSSPCQDFSNAGLQRGGEEGSGTRSSLLWECRRAIIAKRPKYLLLENVAALVSKKFLPLFNRWQAKLESYGYSNFAQVLNAKDYGVPQNRERIFLVSILGDEKYIFPQPFKLELRLKDILEKEVEDRYYLSNKMIEGFCKHNENHNAKATGFIFQPKDGTGVANCIRANAALCPTDNTIIERGRVQEGGKVTPTICTSNELCVYEGIEQKGFLNEGKHQQDYVQGVNGVSRAVCAGSHASTPHLLKTQLPDCRIRKLTPTECFKLMGVTEENIDKIQAAGISNAQQYKMAGNSIVVDVLYHIFRKMFVDKESNHVELTLF